MQHFTTLLVLLALFSLAHSLPTSSSLLKVRGHHNHLARSDVLHRSSALLDTPSDSLARRQSNSTTAPSPSGKLVFAHHIVGNTYPYQVSDWANDIALAQANGIDGFALNVGNMDWEPARVADAYTAAGQANSGFKLFISFDMSSLSCTAASDAQAIIQYITTYATNPSQLTLNGRVFASTFAGESCTFGQGSVPAGWQTQVVDALTGQNQMWFVPSFFVDPTTFSQYNGVIDGMFNFNSGWPIQITTSSLSSLLSSVGSAINSLISSVTGQNALAPLIGSTETDDQYVQGLQAMTAEPNGLARTYMAAASPWFFTHYGADSYNKNWIYCSQEWLYATRWEQIISKRDEIDFVELTTWNDYGESHYLGPIEGAQPNSQAWVDGFDHQGFLKLTKYYATAYKTGSYPAVTEDTMVLWARPHPAAASAPDAVGQPANAATVTDTLWGVVLAADAGTALLSTNADGSGAASFALQPGANKISIDLVPGGTMWGAVTRGGATTVQVSGGNYTFNPNPQAYNFNAFVASGTAGSSS